MNYFGTDVASGERRFAVCGRLSVILRGEFPWYKLVRVNAVSMLRFLALLFVTINRFRIIDRLKGPCDHEVSHGLGPERGQGAEGGVTCWRRMVGNNF